LTVRSALSRRDNPQSCAFRLHPPTHWQPFGARIPGGHLSSNLGGEHPGGGIGQAIDLDEQHGQIVLAELFQQAPVSFLRTRHNRVMRDQPGPAQAPSFPAAFRKPKAQETGDETDLAAG
jgi:hypothetical protein